MEIATPPCPQPFGSEIVCINKALAFFLSFSLDCQMPAVQCPTFAVKFKAMRLTECNLLALKYARPTICFCSLPGWGSHSMAFLNSQRRSQLPWVTNSKGVAGGWPQEQMAEPGALWQFCRGRALLPTWNKWLSSPGAVNLSPFIVYTLKWMQIYRSKWNTWIYSSLENVNELRIY